MTEANRVCKVEGCDNNYRSLGYCEKHYTRLRRHGDVSFVHRDFDNNIESGKGKWITESGYILMRINRGDRPIFEHRYIMEKELGRTLKDHETVHHKNGDRTDNSISNLELWSTYQPYGQRVQDKLEYAREILALYGG